MNEEIVVSLGGVEVSVTIMTGPTLSFTGDDGVVQQVILAQNEANEAAGVAVTAAESVLGALGQYARIDGTNVAPNPNPLRTALGVNNVNNTSDLNKPVSTATQAALNLKINTTQKGVINGVAPLGPDGLIPALYLPTSGSYQGTWDAATNIPEIISGEGDNGDFYIVSVAGTTDIDGTDEWEIGDTIRFNGTVWQKIAANTSVVSVNSMVGAVVLDADDVGALSKDGINAEPDLLENIGAVSTAELAALEGEIDGKLPKSGIGSEDAFLSNVGIGVPVTPIATKRAVLTVTVEAYRTGDILTEYATNPRRSNTRALQAAVNAVSAAGGGTVTGAGAVLPLTNPNLSDTDNERFAVELKPNVRITDMTVQPDDTLMTIFIFSGPTAYDNVCVEGVTFDGGAWGFDAGLVPVPPDTYQDFGRTCIAQRNGAYSTGIEIKNNRFTLPLVDPYQPVVPYHACVMAFSDGECSGNYTETCGGDTYQFNDGKWRIFGNFVGASSDGGIAINNGISCNVYGNYLYKCHLGIGGGPYGYEAESYRAINVCDNVIEACAVGINIGWYSLWTNLVTGASKLDSAMTPEEKADPDWVRRSPARYMKIADNQILRPKYGGIYYISGNPIAYEPTITGNVVSELGSSAYDGTGDFSGASLSGISLVGVTRGVIRGNVVRNTQSPAGIVESFAYVISGCPETYFADNASFGNAIDVKYEVCSLHLGRLVTDGTANNQVVGTVTVLSSVHNITGSMTAASGLYVDGNFGLYKDGSNPVMAVAPNDFYKYDVAADEHRFEVSGQRAFSTSLFGTITRAGLGSVLPLHPYETVITLVTNTLARLSIKGTDGITRSGDIPLS